MAADKEKETEAEFFLDENDDDHEGIEVNKIYDGGSGSSSSDIENVEEAGGDQLQSSSSDAFASQQWPRSYR